MIFGVDERGVHLTNPVEVLSFEEIKVGLESPSVLQIMTDDCMGCQSRGYDAEACDKLGPRWAELQVTRQLQELKRSGSLRAVHEGECVRIPAAYKAGITLFARKGSAAAAALMQEPELPLLNAAPQTHSAAATEDNSLLVQMATAAAEAGSGGGNRTSSAAVPVSAEVQAFADKLKVPSERLGAFSEICETLKEQQKSLSIGHLRDWEESLEEARAEADIEDFLGANGDAVDSALMEAIAAVAPPSSLSSSAAGSASRAGEQTKSGRDLTWARRALESRLKFRAVYAPSEALEAVLRSSAEEVAAAMVRGKDRPSHIQIRRGTWTRDTHGEIRRRSYPYTPALGDNDGDGIIEAVDQASGEVLGYVLSCPSDNQTYIADICALPETIGSGVGAALLAALGQEACKANGGASVELDVRKCNPAVGAYQRAGFTVEYRSFPGWYDWHGGYHMVAPAATLAANLRAMPNVSSSLA